MTGTALSNALNTGNVTIASTSGSGTDGNINVNDAVSWSANTLTLNATNNIYVNNVMTASGTASFAANYGYVLSNGVPTTTPSGTGNADGTPYGLYTSAEHLARLVRRPDLFQRDRYRDVEWHSLTQSSAT